MMNSSGGAAPLAAPAPGQGHAQDASLANDDLLPTTAAQRHWAWKCCSSACRRMPA